MVAPPPGALDRADALRGHAAMLLFSALVAGSFSLGARMAREIDPGVLVLLRFGLAALLMVAILRASTGRWPTVPRAPWRFVVLGGFFGFYFIMMVLAWEISGGHFNPAVTLAVYFSELQLMKNLVTFVLIVVAQFCGAFFGVFLGWMALCDYTYMDN